MFDRFINLVKANSYIRSLAVILSPIQCNIIPYWKIIDIIVSCNEC